MSLSSSYEEIEAEISGWGYLLSLSDYEKSLQSEESSLPREPMLAGRGRGVISSAYCNVRMASEINDLKIHHVPMGREATSREILENPPENEITPLLRKLGISGYDECISSRTTRQNPEIEHDIRMDGNIPVVLNGDLFNVSYFNESENPSEKSDEADLDDDDPTLPLEKRFSTIKEFVGYSGIQQEEALSSKECSDLIKFSSTSNSGGSGVSFSSAKSTSEKDGKEILLERKPLLSKKAKTYTPRELHQLKRRC